MNEVTSTPFTVGEVLSVYRRTKAALEYHCQGLKKALLTAQSVGICSSAYRADRLLEDYLAELKRATWRALLAASGIERVLSVSRMETLERFLEGDGSGDIPEPNEEAVLELLSGGTVKEIFAETVREAFDFLRPGAKQSNTHKTNWKNGRVNVGKKVILRGIVRETPYHVDIYPRYRRHLIQVDKIFHLLDNKPFPFNDTYSSPLVDGLANSRKGKTEYFKWERYGNGNLHLTFLRADLLQKFNQIAGSLVEPAVGDGIAV